MQTKLLRVAWRGGTFYGFATTSFQVNFFLLQPDIGQ